MPVRPLLWVVGVLVVAVALTPAFAADNPNSDPLVRVLESKGILTQAEADTINTAAPTDQRAKLAQILLDKGLISESDYRQVSNAAPRAVGVEYSPVNGIMDASYEVYDPQAAAKPAEAPKAPPIIPAVAPIRVLQLEPAKPGGLVPDIKLGSGAKMKLYGFFKSSIQYDTSLPTGNDAPLPMFGISAADTGPDGAPEFHVKARASRIGANFEWPDIREGTSITARLEADWEGNFTRAFNRNVSSIRSNQFNLRLAWMRVDHMFSDNTSAFALFGQDWTPFGSSILPNSLETTLLGVGFGSMYERDMQARFGFLHKFGDSSFKFGPEFAIVMPAFGNTPPFASPFSTITTGNTGAAGGTTTLSNLGLGPGNLGDQLAYGERQGADSARPEVQGRLVFQWQLDHAKGVAPAQFIISGMQGARTAIVTKAAVPNCTAPLATVIAGTAIPVCSVGGVVTPGIFKTAFPTGVTVNTSRNGWTAGFQLPTRYLTFTTNYYRGTDLRFYFAGQLLKEYDNITNLFNAVDNPTGNLFATRGPNTGLANADVAQLACPANWNCAPSIDGASVIRFGVLAPGSAGCTGADPCPYVVPQDVVRSQGGFAEIGIPLSRIAHADPTGRNAGWTMTLHYGLDSVFAKDARRVGATQPKQSSWGFANLQYKLNQYVTFGYELGIYQTINLSTATWQGIPQHVVHDMHSEFATIFSF